MVSYAAIQKEVGHSYQELSDFLGEKTLREVTKTTRVVRVDSNHVAYQYHATNVVTFSDTGDIVLRDGGYITVTTKQKINDVLPYGIKLYQDRRYWKIYLKDWGTCLYSDGICINIHDWSVAGQDEDKLIAQTEQNKGIDQLIKTYLDGIDDQVIYIILYSQDQGMCFECTMEQTSDLEEAFNKRYQKGHLLEHLKNREYLPTLWYNILHSQRFDNPYMLLSVSRSNGLERIKRYVRRFFRKQLLEGMAP